MNKVVDIEVAMTKIKDHSTLMFGGFGGIGNPPTLIQAILDGGITHLTLVGNDSAFPHVGIGKLITHKRAVKLIASHIGSNPNAGKQMHDKELEVEFVPQGTLVERIRAGGMGLGGVLVDVGVDTLHDVDKEKLFINGKPYLIETALTADVAIVYAKKADVFGNLVFDKSARNTNPLVAMAGDITIVEAEEIVDLGALNPEEIVIPGAFIDYIVQSQGVNWTWAWEKV